MARLTPGEIQKYAYNAGFRGIDLIIAVAVAMAESGGDTGAYNPETAAGTKQGSGSRGLWQIYGAAHPEFNNDSVYDPAKNAQAAYSVYKAAGGRWTPWSTFNNGSYRTFMSQIPDMAASTINAVSGAAANSVNTVAQTASAAAGNISFLLPPGLQAADQGIGNAAKFFSKPENVKGALTDVSFIIGGLALIFIGLGALLFIGAKANPELTAAAGKALAL